jgi:hypothetical protein
MAYSRIYVCAVAEITLLRRDDELFCVSRQPHALAWIQNLNLSAEQLNQGNGITKTSIFIASILALSFIK